MRNITDILARYLSDINLPSVSIIDIIEIILIYIFCISVYGMDQIYPRIYSAQGPSGHWRISYHCIYF